MENDMEYAYDRRRATLAQTLAAIALHTQQLGVGMIAATPVFITGALMGSTSGLHLTEDQASWFAGTIFICQPLGSVLAGLVQDRFSRRSTLIFINLPILIAWLVSYLANSTAPLFVGQAVLGLSIGFMEAPVLAYIGEISEPRLRGVLGSLGGLAFNIGLLIATTMGAVTTWRTMVLFNMTGPVVSALAMSLVPDSPAWQVAHGLVGEAQKSYQWLRGWTTPKAVLEELNSMVVYVQERKPQIVNGEAGHKGEGKVISEETTLKIFLQPAIQRPLRLIVCYLFITVCATLCGMKMFLVKELKTIKLPITTDSYLFCSTVFTFLGALTAMVSVRTLGKRRLTFISLALSIFSCLGLGLYVALGLCWPHVPLFLLLLSSYAATLGIIFIPWVLISEMFPLKGRGMASGFSAATFYVFMFTMIKTYYNLRALVGVEGVCLLNGVVGIVGFFYLYHNLPETEGVPMVDIEAMFYKKPTSVPKEGKETIKA